MDLEQRPDEALLHQAGFHHVGFVLTKVETNGVSVLKGQLDHRGRHVLNGRQLIQLDQLPDVRIRAVAVEGETDQGREGGNLGDPRFAPPVRVVGVPVVSVEFVFLAAAPAVFQEIEFLPGFVDDLQVVVSRRKHLVVAGFRGALLVDDLFPVGVVGREEGPVARSRQNNVVNLVPPLASLSEQSQRAFVLGVGGRVFQARDGNVVRPGQLEGLAPDAEEGFLYHVFRILSADEGRSTDGSLVDPQRRQDNTGDKLRDLFLVLWIVEFVHLLRPVLHSGKGIRVEVLAFFVGLSQDPVEAVRSLGRQDVVGLRHRHLVVVPVVHFLLLVVVSDLFLVAFQIRVGLRALALDRLVDLAATKDRHSRLFEARIFGGFGGYLFRVRQFLYGSLNTLLGSLSETLDVVHFAVELSINQLKKKLYGAVLLCARMDGISALRACCNQAAKVVINVDRSLFLSPKTKYIPVFRSTRFFVVRITSQYYKKLSTRKNLSIRIYCAGPQQHEFRCRHRFAIQQKVVRFPSNV
mmetsp:Transcript_5729/g.13247  ORF Transcript_5729/g.13247 Transcript_5729/m.13247 type:complete len:522 (-) Transcript_5729:178-1743(-)